METYIVTLSTPRGTYDVELIGSTRERAEMRAHMSLVHAGYGDLDEVRVVATVTA